MSRQGSYYCHKLCSQFSICYAGNHAVKKHPLRRLGHKALSIRMSVSLQSIPCSLSRRDDASTDDCPVTVGLAVACRELNEILVRKQRSYGLFPNVLLPIPMLQ